MRIRLTKIEHKRLQKFLVKNKDYFQDRRMNRIAVADLARHRLKLNVKEAAINRAERETGLRLFHRAKKKKRAIVTSPVVKLRPSHRRKSGTVNWDRINKTLAFFGY